MDGIFYPSFMRVSHLVMGVVSVVMVFGTVLSTSAQSQEIDCNVSAYYTPATSQEDFESAVQMNGKGTHGADGTAVYEGMLSSPSQYFFDDVKISLPFGSKIYIPGLGVGAVHDRGGSVKGNKIDVWMGYGEAGKKRAIAWGRKNLKCILLDKNTEETLRIEGEEKSLFTVSLEFGDKGDAVTKMQKFLKEEGFFKEDDFGYFGPKTEKAVFLFQKKYKIVSSENDEGAGMWGPKTRKIANTLLP